MFLYSLLIIFSIFLSMISKGRNGRFFQYASLFLMTLLIIFNRGNSDYEGYYYGFMYDDPNAVYEAGYLSLIKILKLVDWTTFNSVLLVLGVFFFCSFARWMKYSENIAVVMAFMLVFPFEYMVIQVRSTFMMLFFINALLDYIEEKNIRCIVDCLLAVAFHTLGALLVLHLLLIVLVLKKIIKKRDTIYFSKEKGLKIFIFIVVVTIFAIFLLRKVFLAILPQLSQFLPMLVKVPYAYLTQETDFQSMLIWGGFALCDVIIFYFLVFRGKVFSIVKDRVLVVLFLFLVSVCLDIAFLGMLDEFNRLYRFSFIIKFLLLSNIKKYSTKNNRFFIYCYGFISAFICMIVIYNRGIELDRFVNENLLFRFLTDLFH